jgi:gliding motility-associated-like protein
VTRFSFFIYLFLYLSIKGYSQEPNGRSSLIDSISSTNYCHTNALHEKKLKDEANYRYKSQHTDKIIHDYLQGNNFRISSSAIYIIPVVVHIVHQNGTENISDQQVQDGIQHLNEAFTRSPPFQGSGGASVNIQFCLAKQDTNGNFTSGINRVVSLLTNININNDQALKDLIRWDPKRYINIWLVKEIYSGTSYALAGYAYMAAAHGSSYDGIVNEAKWFGSSTDNSKVHIHEMGHYFNLYHTFQNECANNNCMLDGDKVCDTPPDNSSAPVLPCSSFENSCSSDTDDPTANNPFRSKTLEGLGDVNDMFNNYMDYGAQQCQNLFTQGQSDRIIATLLGPRISLLSSRGCNDPCKNPISANFSPSSLTVSIGTIISFNNNSSGATNYDWKINGSSFSSSTNSSYNFNVTGKYSITLIASNMNASCTKSVTGNITVVCPITAGFTSSTTTALINNSVSFTNTSSNSNIYQWLIDGAYYSNSNNLNYTFNTPGIFSVTLIANDGYCKDTISTNIVVTDSCIPINKSSNIWYFGNKSGLDFNSGTPVVLSNSAMMADEGSSVICDQTGNLLFYTNGVTVWNKNHSIMFNGNGLMGHISSTQSSLIVPHPGNSNLYYIFTTTFHGTANGLRYSIVDLSLGGGLGAITAKNILLRTPTTEKIIVIKHANQTDIWIVTHDFYSSNFRTFLIDGSGLNTSPIITNVGINHGGVYIWSAQGYLTSSPQGDRIAISADFSNTWELLDFDNNTGIPSNPITFTNYNRIYGLEFSPNGKLLYASSWINPTELHQFDLSGGTYTSINNSAIVLASYNSDYQACALKTGPDGKIYVARAGAGSSYLGRINFPNVPGVGCNYIDNAVYLSSGSSFYGLPNIMTVSFKPTLDFNYSTNCLNETNFSVIGDTMGKFKWTFGEPASGLLDSSLITNPKHSYFFSTNYTVCLTKRTACRIDSVLKNVSINLQASIPYVDLGKDTSYCDSISLLLDAGNNFTYKWNDSSTNQTRMIIAPGKYWVEITNANSCKTSDTIKIDYIGNSPSLNLKDTTICEGQVCIFNAGTGFDKYQWNDGSFDQKLTAFLPGNYKVHVENKCGVGTDSATLNILPFPLVSFSGLDSSSCLYEEIIVLKGYPAGGIFFGPGILENTFTPVMAGLGLHSITYKYKDSNGCWGNNTQKMIINNSCAIFIPNLITPNGDKINDSFEIIGNPENSKLEIYNRWGDLLYRNEDYDNSWSGENLNEGVYYYIFINGYDQKTHKGWVQILK